MTLDRIVEIAFGYGPFDTVTSWTDVTPFVAVHGDGIWAQMTRGRSGDAITPGTASVTFENLDGRFDPRNTAGPYHGDLTVGTPIRFRCPTQTDPDGTVWSGFISSGWPTALTTAFPTVTITAHDLFGLLAQGSAPTTAFDAAVRALDTPPDHWWRPGPTGWEDQISGITMRHTGALEELDPVVNGDEHSWGQTAPEGVGITTSPAAGLGSSGDPYGWSIISAWVRLIPAAERPTIPPGWPSPVVVVAVQADYSGDLTGVNHRAHLNITHRTVGFRFTTTHGRAGWWTDNPSDLDTLLMDGSLHHVLAAGRPPFAVQGAPPPNLGGQGRLWIDGRRIEVFDAGDTDPFAPGTTSYTPVDVTIGGGPTPYQGALDHIQLWGAWPGTADDDADTDTLDGLAQTLFTAGRYGWANQRLDQRAADIITAMGASNRIGTFDTSGVVTLQSYRAAEPIQLLQTIENTEQGRIWVDRHGDIRYSNRQWAWNDPRSTTPRAAFSTIGTDIDTGAIIMLESGTEIVDDPLDIVNVAQVTSAFGRMQTVRDETSIAEIGQRNPVHLSGLLHRSDAESRAIAEWIIASRSTPRPRARQITFDANDPNAGTFAVDVSEGDLAEITVGAPTDCDGNPLGADLNLSAHVTQVSRSWSRDRQTITLTLDSTRTDTPWFRWDQSKWNNTDQEGWSF